MSLTQFDRTHNEHVDWEGKTIAPNDYNVLLGFRNRPDEPVEEDEIALTAEIMFGNKGMRNTDFSKILLDFALTYAEATGTLNETLFEYLGERAARALDRMAEATERQREATNG